MESQGMVAIVQGLRDAGLTVTLIGDRRARRLTTLKQSSLPHARSSVETSTKGVTAAATVSCVDTAAQICDGRYTSSYQLAHCMARPSSPPVCLAEFPPQRNEPCRTQGNFEVGGLSSGEIHPALQIPTHRETYLRNSFTNDNRGYFSKRLSSRGTQEFVHSLRKYPSLSPNRSVSSELVQRLIAYTQAKNFTKRSYSKSMRSLRNQNVDPSKEANPRTKASKSVQTYTRAKRRKENVPPEKDKEVGKNEDRDVGSSPKKCRTRSPYNMTRNNRSRDPHISATYDYLKIPSPRHIAPADVRYLTEVTRCLRDTLLQICDDRPVVCPNIQSRYSQHRRQHHRDGAGLQSSSASNNVGAQASLPMACTGVPAMSSSAAIPGTYQQTNSSSLEICCRCRKPVPCGCGHSSSSVRVQKYPYCTDGSQSSPKNSRDSELEEQVFKWLEEIPVYANDKLEDKATRENMARHLINELKALQGSNDFDQEARKEIAKCVDNMPMWYPENKVVQEMFKAQIVDNLTGKLSDVSKKQNRFTEEIVQWVDKLDFESRDDGREIINKHNVVDNLINKLKPIALNSQPDTEEYKDALKAEIVNAINELPLKINGDKVTNLNILADNLASRLHKIPTKCLSQDQQVHLGEQFQKEIWEWLKDIPQFANSTLNVKENQKNVEFLAQTLQKLYAKGVDNLETQEQMENEINEWIENNIEGKNQIVLKEKSNLVAKLIMKLLKLEKEVSRDKREKSLSTTPSNTLKIIREWMQDIPDLMSEDEEKNQEIVESLAEKLDEFQSLGKNGTSLEREIFNCLTSMLEKKGKRINTGNQNNWVKQLIGRLKTAGEVEAIVEADKHVIQDIIDCFRDVPEIDMNLEENKKMVEQLAREVQTVQTEELKESDEKKIKDIVVNWLTKITADTGSKLSTTTKNQLVQKLINIATATHKPRRRWSTLNNSQKVKKSLREEVGYVLDKSGTDFNDQEEIVSILTDILVDQVMRGESDSKTRNRILNTIRDSSLNHEQSEGIASRLIKIGKEMSLSFKTQDSTSKFKDMSERISVFSPPQKVTFQESAQKEILDFIEKLIDGDSIVSVDKLKEASRELAEKIEDIISMQSSTILDHNSRRACVEDEILKYLQKLSLQQGVVREQQASLLADRLQNLAIKTSTPKRTSFEKEISFRPRRDSTGSTISTINDISQHMPTQAIENEEQQYINQLLNIIDGWMNNLPIDLESDEGKRFKDVMVRDLAGDIVDRQKYLQLNPDAKTSDGEELEHLKYQVFRWLNKLPDVKCLLPSISKADHLMDRIKSLPVPQLKKSPERSRQLARNSHINNLSKDLAMLRIEILKWIEAVPDKFHAVSDKKHQLKLVEELAEQIHDLHRDGTLTESVFDDVGSQWLRKMLKEYNDHYFNSLIEGLKGLLASKKLITLNFTSKKVNDLHAKRISLGNLEQEKELPFENDTIHTIILKWSKNLPWQPKKRIEKSQIDQLATKIEKIMANVQPNNYNSISSNLEKEIKTFVARLSVQKNKLKDSQINELVNNITEFYKCNLSEDHSMANTSPQIQTTYTNNSVSSKPGFKKAADILYENIENWCDNLPIQIGSTPEEKEKVKTLKQNIASKLINVIGDLNMKPEIFNDDSLYEDLLNDEIDNLLSTLPLNPMLERNIPALKENLVEKVKEMRQKTQDKLAGQAYKQQLREAISRNLPSVENLTLEEQAPFEVLKDNVADAFVELHYAADNDTMKTKLRNRISNEINNFCNDYLKRYPASPIDPRQLNSELYGVLQKIPIPKDETIKSQVEQVRIKDKINNWIKELPLKKEETPSEKIQRKKIVAIMAKDLHDIEKEKESNPHIDVGDLMKKEIKKWITKLLIQPSYQDNVEHMVDKLVSKLISTEESKENGNSYIRHNADFVEQETAKPSSMKTLPLSTYLPHLPPSTLSTEDRAHLQRIRERNQQKQIDFMPSYSPCQCKDASVSPIPIDTGSQVDLEETQRQTQTTSAKTTQSCECSPMHSTKSIQSQSSPYNQFPIPQSSKRREYPVPDQAISPQVEVREYYWDSTNEGQAQVTSVIPYAVSEQQGFAENTLLGDQTPNQTYRNQSPENQSGRPLTSQQSPSPPQKFVTSSDRMGQTMTQKSPFVTPQLSLHRQTQYAPRMTTPVESSQPFMTSQSPYTTSDRPFEPCGPQLPMRPCPHQSTMQSSHRSMPQPNMASGLPEKSLYVPQQPVQTPFMAEPNSATPASPYQSPRRIPPFVSQETPREERRRGTSKPYFASRDISGTSSPFDTDIPEAETRTRVTRLGSLDDVPYTKTCGNQSPKPKRSRASPNEDSDWTIRFPEDTGFWGTPCPRRRPHRSPQRERSYYVKQKERKEEKMRCRCQERTRTKCMGRRPETCHQSPNHPIQPHFMNQCPKCCGVHCPHPSYLFFR